MQVKSFIIMVVSLNIGISFAAPVGSSLDRRYINPFGVFRSLIQTSRLMKHAAEENERQENLKKIISTKIPHDAPPQKVYDARNIPGTPPPAARDPTSETK